MTDATSPVNDREQIEEEQEEHDEETPLINARDQNTKRKSRARKVSFVAIVVLICIAILGLVLGFILPHVAQSYVEDTLQFDIDSIKLEGMTEDGANVRVRGAIFLDRAKNSNKVARSLTNLLLSIAGPISISDSSLKVMLQYDGSHTIATTDIDDLRLSLAHEQRNHFDMTTNVVLQNGEIIGNFVHGILNHEFDTLPLTAIVSSKIQRLISLRKTVSRDLEYKIPQGLSEIPGFNITRLLVKDDVTSGISAKATVLVDLKPPVEAHLPTVVLEASIMGCNGELIPMARGMNQPIHLSPDKSVISVDASGICAEIPKMALKPCSKSDKLSPLDVAMQTFLDGNATRVYLSGAKDEVESSWLQTVMQQVSIPIDVPGSQSQQFARDIELSDVKFNIPSFLGGGGKPKISGKVRGTIDIPADVNVNVRVDSVHVLADLLYKGRKFAYLESPGWAPATSNFPKQEELLVQVVLKDAPVTITNQDVFSSVVSQLLGGTVLVDVVGTGDVKVITSLGKLEAHKLPIEAKDIEIGGFGFLDNLEPKITELGVLQTTSNSLDLMVEAEVHNPTSYQASASYLDVLMTYENATLGHLTVRSVDIQPGNNTIRATLRYAPLLYENGERNAEIGSKMLSSYLSEEQVNVTLKAHNDSIPEYPNLSRALAYLPLSFTLPMPRLIAPANDGNDDEGGDGEEPHGTGSQFLVSAKFHLFSSSASFILRNPLNTTITITDLHAVARYHGDTIGVLAYGYPITLSGTDPETETNKLPVSWKLPASDILRRAVRGTLRVNATATAVVSVGDMSGIPVSLTIHEVGASVGI